ncbi:7 transmembrane sweet-taste receptor of 3 GCPR-domain-containing protein [Dissophora ornata]|nr:7 transmembrane sweet-taste receptor of 3 GCPR-domain-containing protein [Dissophora ornata]
MESIALEAKKRNISIGYQRAFWEMGTSSDVGSSLDALRDSGQQIVLVAAIGVPQSRLLTEAVRKGLISKDYVWMTTHQVAESLLGMEGSTLKPMELNGLFMFDNMLRLHGYPPYEEFLDRWAALDPAEYPYAGERDISSNEAQAYSCMMVLANGFANAAKGNGTALHQLAEGKLGYMLKPLDMNTNYTGPGGPMVFDETGDVIDSNFILYNFQNGRMVDIGTSYSGVFNLSAPPVYFDGTYKTPSDTAPLRVLNPTFGSSIALVIMTTAGLGIVFSLLTMGIVVVYRDAQVIKASSPLFCCLELCGFILLYFSAIMGLDIPTKFLCIARPFTLNVGFILVVSNIVAKNFRVYRIFHNIYVTKRVIRDSHLLKIVGTILAINMVIMTIWFIRTPPTLQQITMGDFTTYWDCNSQAGESTPYFVLLFVYNVVLLLLATYLGYKNRNVAANYNECRQIAFVVYNILLSGCIAMPTVFLPRDQFLIKFFLSNIVLLFGTTVSLMFMFLPKLWKLFSLIEKSKQTLRDESTGESSFDGLFNNRASWLNTASGIDTGSSVGGYIPGARKGSIGSLDDSKSATLKESHVGYMGVKFQNRYFPFLSSWCMRRVILFPSEKYFTAFESGKPEAGRTYSYRSASIHSRESGSYILRVIGCGSYNFLLQVKDEERLMHWCSLFENKSGSNSTSSTDGNTTLLALSNLHINVAQTRSESDQTLQAASLNSWNNGKSGRSKMGNADDGCYFSRATRGSPSSNGLSTPHQHRRTLSSHTMVTFTASPGTSFHEKEQLRAKMEPASRQTTLGASDVDPNNSGHSMEPNRSGQSPSARSTPPRHTHRRVVPEEQEVEDGDC